MGPKDRDYAVAFAIPIDHPGLTLYVSPYSAGDATRNSFDHPVSSRHKLLESLTVFDNVRVPKERVFLNRKPERAGPVKDKITSLIAYAETVRGLGQLAHLRSTQGPTDMQEPDPLAVNMAKYAFAH